MNDDNKPIAYRANFKRVNLIVAATQSHIVHYKLLDDNVDSDRIIDFFTEFYTKLSQLNMYAEELAKGKIFCLMDNAKFHKSEKVLNYFRDNKMNIIFISPYCPESNFAQQVFGLIKRNYMGCNFNSRYDNKKIIY
jgi:hypothetical protein